MTKKKTAAPRKGGRKNRRRPCYAVPCMVAILVVAAGLSAVGHAMRGSMLAGLPQYEGAPDIAVPLMLLQDDSPLREARERAAWEAEQAAAAAPIEPTAAPIAVAPAEPTAAPVAAAPAEPTEGPFAPV